MLDTHTDMLAETPTTFVCPSSWFFMNLLRQWHSSHTSPPSSFPVKYMEEPVHTPFAAFHSVAHCSCGDGLLSTPSYSPFCPSYLTPSGALCWCSCRSARNCISELQLFFQVATDCVFLSQTNLLHANSSSLHSHRHSQEGRHCRKALHSLFNQIYGVSLLQLQFDLIW